mgnify:CR=1 FL=1
MDAVEFGGDAVLQECRLRLSLDLFFNLAVYQLLPSARAIHSSGLEAAIWALDTCGRSRTQRGPDSS